MQFYRARFEDVGWRENAVYPGIAQLLRALRAAGKRASIVTAKPERFAVRIAEYFGLAPYLDAVVGIPMNEHHADKAALIARALPAGADKARVVMVGDRKFDVLGAKDAGVSSLAVGYGYGTARRARRLRAGLVRRDRRRPLPRCWASNARAGGFSPSRATTAAASPRRWR